MVITKIKKREMHFENKTSAPQGSNFICNNEYFVHASLQDALINVYNIYINAILHTEELKHEHILPCLYSPIKE